jgi:hypothetical protein
MILRLRAGWEQFLLSIQSIGFSVRRPAVIPVHEAQGELLLVRLRRSGGL